jgi:catechol 2,3-dioxygenase-like lactoylglutathione lyase family enzyme
MGLDSCKVEAIVAVSDVDEAKEFYEGKLGFGDGTDEPDGGITYQCAESTSIHIYPSPDNAGKSGATVAGFRADDLDALVDELSGNGVEFERYDQDPIKTDEKGIATLGEARIAWIKDPDGNILGVGS